MKDNCANIAFLALTLWREARGESEECLAAVAATIMNRASRRKNLMATLFKPMHFSSLTDPKDKQLTTWPREDDPSWERCLKMAHCAVEGVIHTAAQGADHYYDISIVAPNWADPKKFVCQIGRVRFFNLEGML